MTQSDPSRPSPARTLLFALLLLLLCVPLAVAQEESAEEDAAENGSAEAGSASEGASESGDDADEALAFPTQVEQITVTARRREETAQEIPGAISVISEETLELKQVTNTRQVQESVPNVVIERNTGTSSGAKIFLRGVGADESLFTSEPAVGIYVDDVYIPRQTGASFDIFDIDRIEVLRGPQGTLYGRNTNGGAIKLYTVLPEARRRMRFNAAAGQDSEVQLGFSAGGGLGETVFGKIAALHKSRDGYSTDLVNGRDVNDEDVTAFRTQLRITPSDQVDLLASLDFVRERSTPGFASSIINNPDNDLYTLTSGLDGLNDLDQGGLSFRAEVLPSDSGLRFSSITAYRELDNLLFLDADGLPSTNFHLFQDQEQSQISQELQLGSISGGDFQWDVGIFYFEEDNEQPTRTDIFATGATNTIQQDTTSYAVFGQGTWRRDRLSFTGGLRYSYEEKDFRVDSVLASGNLNFTNIDSDDWNTLDWRAELIYAFKESLLGYVTAATGFKSGGFNGRGTSPAAQQPFDEEEVTSFEVGVKSDFADRRVRLNANYYFTQYDGLQLSTLDSAGVFRTINAADTEIQGIELDFKAVPVDRFEINATLGTIDGEYKGAVPGFPSDNELKQAPDITYSLGLQYTWLLSQSGYVTARADYSYTADHFQNVANSPLIRTDSYGILNARVAYGPASGVWEVALLGTNLTDEEYFTGGFDIAGLGIGVAYLNKPSWVGASFSWRF